jgi:hypothetical protein
MKNFIGLVFFILPLFSTAQYQQFTERELKKAFTGELKGFRFYGYPTDNFGVATTCKSKWDPIGAMVGDMIYSLGLDTLPLFSTKWRDANGYASIGGAGLPIIFGDTINNTLAAGLLIPKILKLFNLDAGFSNKDLKGIRITMDSVAIRRLNIAKYLAHIRSLPETSEIRKNFMLRRLVVVTADVVAYNFQIELTNTDTMSIRLNAAIDSVVLSGKTITGNDTVGLSIARNRKGYYIFGGSKPVVLAVYIQKQSKIETPGVEPSLANWSVLAEGETFIDPTIPKK